MVFNVFLFYLPAYGRDAAVYRTFKKEKTVMDQDRGGFCRKRDVVCRRDVFSLILRLLLLGIRKHLSGIVFGRVRGFCVML